MSQFCPYYAFDINLKIQVIYPWLPHKCYPCSHDVMNNYSFGNLPKNQVEHLESHPLEKHGSTLCKQSMLHKVLKYLK